MAVSRMGLPSRSGIGIGVSQHQKWCSFSSLGAQELKIAPRSPWQNPYVERLIGTLRRECLDHVVVLNDAYLRRVLRAYLAYYHEARTPLSLGKDAPEPRSVERPDRGRIVATPMVVGLHHRYTRREA